MSEINSSTTLNLSSDTDIVQVLDTSSGFAVQLDTSALTANRIFTFPDVDGTPVLSGGAFTNGSVLFASGGVISQDNANFFWDDGNNWLRLPAITPDSVEIFTLTNQGGPISTVPWDYSTAASGGATRIRSSTWNFLSNSSFEYWLNGTSVAPNGWTLQGDATVSRITPGYAGTYAAQIIFGTANTGELYQPIGTNTQVDYVFTCYVERTAGTGNARLVAQRNDAPFTEFASVALPTGPGQNLVSLRFMPTAGTLTRFAIKSGDTVASTWKVDECMYQESKDVATTWQPRFLDDETDGQQIYGAKIFNNGPLLAVNGTSTFTAIFSGTSSGPGINTAALTLNHTGAGTGNNVGVYGQSTGFGSGLNIGVYGFAAGNFGTNIAVYSDGQFQSTGSISLPFRSSALGTALTNTDYFLLMTGGGVATLPFAAGITGRVYAVRRTGGATTIAAAGGQTIDGVASISIGPTTTVQVICTGATTWVTLSSS